MADPTSLVTPTTGTGGMPVQPPDSPFTYNMDVTGIVARMDRFITEVVRCGSNVTAGINTADFNRIGTYLAALTNYIAWVNAAPNLDLPKSVTRTYQLDPSPMDPDIESEDLQDVARLLIVSRDELINSNSSRCTNGLEKFDSDRLMAAIVKTQGFLASYVGKVSPLDLPQSMPQDAPAPAGAKGV